MSILTSYRRPYSKFVQVSREPLEILQFISGGFVPMNEMCEHAGMSDFQSSSHRFTASGLNLTR